MNLIKWVSLAAASVWGWKALRRSATSDAAGSARKPEPMRTGGSESRSPPAGGSGQTVTPTPKFVTDAAKARGE